MKGIEKVHALWLGSQLLGICPEELIGDANRDSYLLQVYFYNSKLCSEPKWKYPGMLEYNDVI